MQVAISPYLSERGQWLVQTVDRSVFAKIHVERAQIDYVDDGRHLVEALDPLAALISLTANVERVKLDIVNHKMSLLYAAREYTASEYVLIRGQILLTAYEIHAVEKVLVGVDEVVFVAEFGAPLEARVAPELSQSIPENLYVVCALADACLSNCKILAS